MGLISKIENDVIEESSFSIKFTVTDNAGVEVTPSSLKVYVYLDEEPTEGSPTYINGRDGTNGTGLSNSGADVTFNMSPDDNQLVDSSATYELHRVAVEVKYNADADKDYFEWILKVANRAYIT